VKIDQLFLVFSLGIGKLFILSECSGLLSGLETSDSIMVSLHYTL
jgi:hypothetical protein